MTAPFDDMRRRLEELGVDPAKADRLSTDVGLACDALRYTDDMRQQLAITLPQAFASGTIGPDELRSLREQAPFLNVTSDPNKLLVSRDMMAAIFNLLRDRAVFENFKRLISGPK